MLISEKKCSHPMGISLYFTGRDTRTNLLQSTNLPVSKVVRNLLPTKCYKYLRTSLITIINTFSEQIKTDGLYEDL